MAPLWQYHDAHLSRPNRSVGMSQDLLLQKMLELVDQMQEMMKAYVENTRQFGRHLHNLKHNLLEIVLDLEKEDATKEDIKFAKPDLRLCATEVQSKIIPNPFGGVDDPQPESFLALKPTGILNEIVAESISTESLDLSTLTRGRDEWPPMVKPNQIEPVEYDEDATAEDLDGEVNGSHGTTRVFFSGRSCSSVPLNRAMAVKSLDAMCPEGPPSYVAVQYLSTQQQRLSTGAIMVLVEMPDLCCEWVFDRGRSTWQTLVVFWTMQIFFACVRISGTSIDHSSDRSDDRVPFAPDSRVARPRLTEQPRPGTLQSGQTHWPWLKESASTTKVSTQPR